MRHLLITLLASCVSLATAGAGHCADALKIRDVRVGFSSVNEDYYKSGAWAPVIVEIENQIVGEDFEGTLVVESADGDGVLTRFSPRKVYIAKGEKQRTYVSYIKVSGSAADVRVTVQGQIGSAPYQAKFNYPAERPGGGRSNALAPDHKLILALGDPRGLVETQGEDENSRAWEIGKNWHSAFQTNVNLLPDKWFGYEGVDVIVLPTGGNWSNSLAQSLATDQLKRGALAQWVEMGGHLVISVSANHNFVGNPNSFPLEPLLPARIDTTGTIKVERLDKVRALVDDKVKRDRRYLRDSDVKSLGAEVVRLQRRLPAQALAEEDNPKLATIVQGSRGLGRITLIGFDLDQGPFTTWENRRDFWPALLDIKPSRLDQGQTMWRPQFGGPGGEADLAAQLCANLEQFGEVKVIPFAWVALFIFVYILIVGPLDYLILKKVVKRLEWTWVTFPIVVLAVSLGAYFLAHYLKGNELRINKVDLVEIDAHAGQAYGSTWFTVFSPRLQRYDMGIEPVGFGPASEGTVVSWMGRPGSGARALGRGQSLGLFSRFYEYENEGQSVKDVPIQVWSMKTFTGRWEAALDPAKPPVRHALQTDRLLVDGSVTSLLPFTLHNCQLVYRKAVWDLGTMETGQEKKLTSEYSQLSTLSQAWGVPNSRLGASGLRRSRPDPSAQTTSSLTGLMRQMMFHDAIVRSPSSGSWATENEYLDYLDQSWRLEFPEAILIGLLEDADGSSTELNQQMQLGTRLKPFNPALRGTLRQSTVVRIYLPVKVISGK